MRVDLNADVGESATDDPALLRSVTSVNIACGFHAGTPSTIRSWIRAAREHSVAAGAHPSLADREGLGRRVLSVAPAEVEDLVLYQVSALLGIAAAEGVKLTHVKPHGALYHMASAHEEIADAIARATAAVNPTLCLVGFSGSCLIDAARRVGLTPIAEAFVDRAYGPDGDLVSRGQPGALIQDSVKAADQAMRIVLDRRVRANDATTMVAVVADTLCVHSDTPGAATIASAVRTALERAGVVVAALK